MPPKDSPFTRLFTRSQPRHPSQPVDPSRVYEINLYVNEQSQEETSHSQRSITGLFARAASTSVASNQPISWSQFGPSAGWVTPGTLTSSTTYTANQDGLHMIQGSVSGAPPLGGASLGININGVSNLTIPQTPAAVNSIWSWSTTLRLNSGDTVQIVNNGTGNLTVVIGDPSAPTSWWNIVALN